MAQREGADLAARVQLREITNEEGNRLLRIVRRTSGPGVTGRRAQIVLLSAQGMTPPRISEVVFTDPDTVRDVIDNFNRDGFDALYPRYRGGRPRDVGSSVRWCHWTVGEIWGGQTRPDGA